MITVAPPPRGPSIFSTMTQLAMAHDAINLAQGFPDFDGPEAVKDAAINAIKKGQNQYAPSVGLLPLREKIARYYQDLRSFDYDPATEVTIFSGATEGLFCAIAGLLNPGDEFIGLDPHYESYLDTALAFGIAYRGLPLRAPDWQIDFDALAAMITPQTKALIINTPHNPTGRVFDQADLQALARLAVAHDLLVITDEVYENLTYDGQQHRSLASYPGMRERTVVISSTSKSFSMTGWKIGYGFGPANLMARLRFIHQAAVFCSATPLQYGMLAAFDAERDYFAQLNEDYAKKRNALCERLADIGFACTPPQGSYFVLAGYDSFSDEPDEAFAKKLVKEARVASIPISGFFADQDYARKQRYVRFAFCKDLKTLDAAYDRLKTYLR